MSAMATSEVTPAAAITLTRAEKEVLLRQMYSLAHWIELIRLIGYQSIPMDKARQAIKPLAEQYGKEPVASACETLVEIFTLDKEPYARLKQHVRRMAFQILGPEPPPDAVPQKVTAAPSADPPEADTRQRATPSKKKKPAKDPTPASKDYVAPVNGHAAIMQQYRAAKEKHPNMLLLFRMGDFYELFDQDAETAHKLLGLTLTTRDRTVAMAGFPHHQLEVYLHKLLHEGQRVAICEPVEESLVRGPIRREVTRVVTPGTTDKEETPTTEQEGNAASQPVRQPRVHVLKQYEAWLTKAGLAFVAVEDVKRTTPAVAPFVSALDFIVLHEDEKLLVTVRPHLQAKHLQAIRELQNLFGQDYRPVRIWPNEGPNGYDWHDHAISVAQTEATAETGSKPKSKRSRARKSE